MRKLYSILLCLATMQANAQAPFVFTDFDLNKGIQGFSRPYNFASYNGKFVFTAYQDGSGYEPWVSDGTQAGTMLLKDVYPGTTYSNCFGYTAYNGKLYFSARSKAYSIELWETDGTPAGTKQVIQISAYSPTNGLAYLRVFNGKMYFVADDSTLGQELWVSDGTANGTQVLKDINNGTGDSWPRDFTEYNGKLYFNADDGTNGRELWVSDGTTQGTVMLKDIAAGSSSSTPDAFFVSSNVMYFRATTPATGYELWKTDGTIAGTQMVKEICPGPANGIRYAVSTLHMITYKSKVYFTAFDSTHGLELWVTDGTSMGTQMVEDINKGSGWSGAYNFAEYNNLLYFSAADTAQNAELWVTDGTSAGTSLVIDIAPGQSFGSSPSLLTVYKNHLYFRAQISGGDQRLHRSDGTALGTQIVAPANSTKTNPLSLVFTTQLFVNPADSTLYLAAEFSGTGAELWSIKDTTGSVSVNSLSNKTDFVLYPNPNNGTFMLALDNVHFKNATVQVYDITGRLCYSAPVTETHTPISIDNAQGIYLVRLQLDDAVLTKYVTVQ